MSATIKTLLICLLTSLLLIGCSQKETVFQDNIGNTITLSDLKNKWLIVNYWASWCPTCLKEIPELNQFYKQNKDKLIFVSVNYDPSPEEDLNTTAKKIGIEFPVLTKDPYKAWSLGDIAAIPTTFIINPQGQVVKKIVGETTAEELSQLLKDLSATAHDSTDSSKASEDKTE